MMYYICINEVPLIRILTQMADVQNQQYTIPHEIVYDGIILNSHQMRPENIARFKDVATTEKDVFIVSYPRSGMNVLKLPVCSERIRRTINFYFKWFLDLRACVVI